MMMTESAEVDTTTSLRFPKCPLLPPCRVCGDKGSGFHYGVNTCDSCKGFFQRYHKRQIWPTCMGYQYCSNSKHKKGMCSTCRFQKCIALGMSKKASKTGRYSHRQKTEYTVEVQQLEVQVKMCKSEQGLLTEEERERELDRMIEHLTEEHLKLSPPKEFFEELTQREEKYMQDHLLKQELFGTMKPLSYEEYSDIYEKTGIDIDGRRQIITNFIPSMEKFINKYINFVKILPGFHLLPLEDKIKLLKGSIFACDILSSYHTYNKDVRAWSDPFEWSNIIGEAELCMFYDTDMLDRYAECLTELQNLDLTPSEQALLQSYGIVLCDVYLSPEGHRILAAIQDVIIDAFYQILLRHHDDVNHFITKVVSAAVKVLTLSQRWRQADRVFYEKYKDLPFTQTLKELYFEDSM